jgi:bacterioferritin-associated ferredoxin
MAYVCTCARVREREIRKAIRHGARCEDAVGDVCGAGVRCGMCLDMIAAMLSKERPADAPVKPAG